MNYSINLNQPYKSVENLTAENLPDFAVLIGRNGAGKTQILEALDQGIASIDHIDPREIELHNTASFVPPEDRQTDRNDSQLGTVTANAYLSPPDGTPPIETARGIFENFVNEMESNSGVQARKDFELNLRATIKDLPRFAIFGMSAQDSLYERTIFDRVLSRFGPRNTRHRRTHSSDLPKGFNGDQATLISTAMSLNGKLPHELNRQDITRAAFIEGHLISNPFNEVFTTYKLDEFHWIHTKFENSENSTPFNELREKYRRLYPPPWKKLREIMSEMRSKSGESGLFDFEFSDPDNHDLNVGNFHNFHFRTSMTNRTSKTQYSFESLSSGEKILMTLCLISFNQYLDRPRPKLLLLDEIDTLLHPSLLPVLSEMLNTLFVNQGTKILMTSHSPMTVAALEESSVFRVIRNDRNVKVGHASKSEAINELSGGLATADMGLRIAAHDGARVTILTEGNNTKHLKGWANLYFDEDVQVFDGLEEHTSDNQLFTYGRLLAKINTSAHILIVWDCDAKNMATKLRDELPQDSNVTPFAFPHRLDNQIAKKGIENNYDENILEPYVSIRSDTEGNELGRDFRSDRKTEFANHVLHHGTERYFANYQDLHDVVSKILGP